MTVGAALPRPPPYSHATSKVLSAAANIAAAEAFAAAADFSDGNLGPAEESAACRRPPGPGAWAQGVPGGGGPGSVQEESQDSPQKVQVDIPARVQNRPFST